MIPKILSQISLFTLIILSSALAAKADWEIGVKTGFESNVDRSVDNGKDDACLSGYLSWGREPSGESRLGWMLGSTIERWEYKKLRDLSYGAISLYPGVVYFPHRLFSLTINPYFQAKEVRDSEQSSLAFGGKVSLKEQLRPNVYMGEYYLYRHNYAKDDTYSFVDNAVGLLAGVNWTPSLMSEVAYEYSHGDSFRTIGKQVVRPGTGHGTGGGQQHRYHYSKAFGEFVTREPVNRHEVGIEGAINWTKSCFSIVSYTFGIMRGKLGSSPAHSGFMEVGYSF
jgi:hypothetical protein